MLGVLRLRASKGVLAAATAAFVATAVPNSISAPAVAQAAQSISASDKAAGAKAHSQILAEFGGAMSGSTADYVARVGKSVALQSGLSNAGEDFTITLLNSPVNNAFAIPGGYVYITRGLVALMNSEAELAAVLGHEIGHVAARHSAKREQAANRNTIFGVLGQVLGAAVGGSFGGLIGQSAQYGTQMLTLSYSRKQETEADGLGLQYLRGAGFDPRALSTMLASLANQTALDARIMGSTNRPPEWASTHPDPGSRVRAALSRAGNVNAGITRRDAFLSRIDGLTYGDDPRQGVVEGASFVHPGYRLAFEAPRGFRLTNGSDAVTISGRAGQAQMSSERYGGNLDSYVRQVFATLTGNTAQIPWESIERTMVNGLPAAFANARVNTSSGQVDVVVFAYEFSSSQAFHFVTLTAPGDAHVFSPMFDSMRRISSQEAASVRPRRIQVYTVRAGDTLNGLARKMAYPDYQLERFLVLNGLAGDSDPAPGQKVKLVVGGEGPV
jgi:predicted Zn-dependent protease